ncbi:MAG: hypothetical protein K8J31_32050 [Anaerolineae bacterium]|nr:hypothetical protein [Anaerolineae bacterium]
MSVERTNRMTADPERGRTVVIGRELVPDMNGRVTVYRTKFDPDAEPIIPELEIDLLKNASSEAMRSVLADALAQAKGEKPERKH